MSKYPTTKLARVPEPMTKVGVELLSLVLTGVRDAVRDHYRELAVYTDQELDVRVLALVKPKHPDEQEYLTRYGLRCSFQYPKRGLVEFTVDMDGSHWRV